MPRLRKPKSKVNRNDEVPEVYREMLADADTSSPILIDHEGRTAKRRRVGGRIVTTEYHHASGDAIEQQMPSVDNDDELSDLFEEVITRRPSIVRSDSEDSASSDQEWEEVDLHPQEIEERTPDPTDGEPDELTLVLENDGDAETRLPRKVARKPMTFVEKELRLHIHKMHLCCLLAHVFIRNHWCNDESLHTALRRILIKKTISYLNPSEEMSQFQQSRSFMDGLEQASEAFRMSYNITSRGMSRPHWAESPDALARCQPPTDIDLPIMKEDFRAVGRKLKASRDVGAQLFCALLRSVGVDSRLVCSLQVLPFNSHSPPTAPMHPKYAAYHSTEYISTKRPIRESRFPVYWIEAFNEAVQKWIPVDPLVTKTISRPSKFEPPASDQENKLTYVIAFEEDGSARDVTRRYAQAYNAKTRRDRVESTKSGDRWWKSVLKLYRRRHRLDRDQLDDAEMSKKEAAEPMPKNVQDFKDHPYYALERHLRRHEVIHPKREAGKVGVGRSGGNPLLEPIFRRRDVHHVQSADKWYRTMGREIKPGEQPLKRVPARRARDRSVDPDNEDEENAGTALYAIHQTTLYTAPPVVNGRIPKNIYGNIDIYVSTMIPPGGSHIKDPDTIRAAKILGIDFAEAVTGFVFKGRHGTAVSQGAVVATEYREAVEEVISALQDERVQAEEAQRSHEALRMWKRLLAGLRIRERIEGYEIEGERDAVQQVKSQVDEEEEVQSDQGGGFFPAQEAEEFAEPTGRQHFQQRTSMDIDEKEHGGFDVDDAVTEGKGKARQTSDRFLDNVDDDEGGGFLVEDDHDEDAEEALESALKIDADTHEPTPMPLSRHSPVIGANDLPIQHKEMNNGVEANISNVDSETDMAIEAEESLGGLQFSSELSQAELDEARLLQQLYEAELTHTRQSDKPEVETSEELVSEPIRAVEREPDADRHATVSNLVGAAPTSPIPAASTAPSEVESPKSDKGSLLSEDPEDEDAEPDWLI